MAKKKQSEGTDLDRICLDCFDYTPDELDELYDVLDDCGALISKHIDTTSSFSENTRRIVARLSLKKDGIQLRLNNLYIASTDNVSNAKRVKHLNIKLKKDQKQKKSFRKEIDGLKRDIESLIADVRSYLEMVEKLNQGNNF